MGALPLSEQRIMIRLAALPILLVVLSTFARAESVNDLARDFWTWRATEQPFSSDDIVRIERPAGWVPDWSPRAVAGYRRQLQAFELRWKKLRNTAAPIPQQVDYCLIGSALARVRWELVVNRGWERNPLFYNDQTLGAYVHLLLDPSPYTAERTGDIVATLQSIPLTIGNAKKNLSNPIAPFARLALDQLETAAPGLAKSVEDLKPLLDAAAAQDIDKAEKDAVDALQSYKVWLK
jgi:hypothetical protein